MLASLSEASRAQIQVEVVGLQTEIPRSHKRSWGEDFGSIKKRYPTYIPLVRLSQGWDGQVPNSWICFRNLISRPRNLILTCNKKVTLACPRRQGDARNIFVYTANFVVTLLTGKSLAQVGSDVLFVLMPPGRIFWYIPQSAGFQPFFHTTVLYQYQNEVFSLGRFGKN